MTLRPRRLPALVPVNPHTNRPRASYPPPERRCSRRGCRAWTACNPALGMREDRCYWHGAPLVVPVVLPELQALPEPAVEFAPAPSVRAHWWVWRGVGLPDAGPMSRAEMLAWRAE